MNGECKKKREHKTEKEEKKKDEPRHPVPMYTCVCLTVFTLTSTEI